MKKTITSLVAICAIGVCALAGCSKVGEDFAISNKEELQAEWHVGDANRQIEFTCADEEFNPTALVSSGDITIESSEPEVVGVVGSLLYPLDAGASTITAKYGRHKDTVVIEVKDATTYDLPYTLGKEYYLAEDVSGVTRYFTGNQVGTYDYEGEMSADPDDAVPVILSAADDGGYYMQYVGDGQTVYYVCITDKDGYQDLQFKTTPTPIYYYGANDAWVNADATYYLGWHSQYNCLYASSISGIDTYQHAYLMDPVNATKPTVAVPVTGIEEDTTYNLGIVLKGIQYYFNGSVQKDYYLDVSSNVSDAVAITPTPVDGTENGYTLKFNSPSDASEVVFYAYVDNASHYTVLFDKADSVPTVDSTTKAGNTITDVTTTFIWDDDIDGFTVTLGDQKCAIGLGTSSQSTYTEITLAKLPDTGAAIAHFYAI